MRSLVAAIALVVATGAACATLSDAVRPPCAVTLIALPTGEFITADDPVPAGSQILAGPGDFDPQGTKIENDAAGLPAVTLRLRGEAAERLATHTAAHVGDLLAIAINGDIVAVPMIMDTVAGGELTIGSGGDGAEPFVQRFAGCVR